MNIIAKTSVLHTFWPYIKQHSRLLFISLATLMLSTGMRLLEPWPLAFVIDYILVPNKSKNAALPSFLSNLDTSAILWGCALGVIGIAALKAMMGYLSTMGLALAGSRILSAVRMDLFTHLQSLSLSFHRTTKTGDLTMRLINDIGMLREATITALMPMLANFLILTGMFSIMLTLNWQLTFVALLPMPWLIWSTRRTSKKIHQVSRATRKKEGSLAAKAAESIAGIGTIQALSIESAAINHFRGDDKESLQQNVKAKRLSAGLERKVDLIIAVATAMVLLQGSYSVLNSEMTPGDLLIFLSYLKNSFRPVREYAKYTGRLSKALAAGERIVELLHQQPDIADKPDAIELSQVRGSLYFEHIHFAYSPVDNPEHLVLRDIDFHINEGQSLAIVGPSGSGKSTITNLLLRLYDPLSGKIIVNNQDIRDYKIHSLRRQISFVPQETLLFGISIRENIALAALTDVTDEQIIAAAKLANVHEFILSLPQGYDTILSERGSTLSGGQRQRISIARAAIRNNPILILDEPTVGLDSENEHIVTEALLRLMENRYSLLITHNLQFASRADYILFIEDGKIMEKGTHQELLALEGRYAQLWYLQNNK